MPATYVSSPGVTRFFCTTCGSQMAYRSAAFPAEMHFYAATLDDPQAFVATKHLHADERLPWLHLTDSLPQI